MRCLLTLAWLLIATAALDAQKVDDETLDRAGKRLLDPKYDNEYRANLTIVQMAKAKGVPHIIKAAESYGERWEKENDKKLKRFLWERYEQLLTQTPAEKMEDRHVKTLINSLDLEKAGQASLFLIDWLGECGPRAKAALPFLRKVRETARVGSSPDEHAAKAIKSIEGKK